jgi:hypothetical protein
MMKGNGKTKPAIFFFLAFLFMQPVLGQDLAMDDLSVMSVTEEFGKWKVSFNWSDMEDYASSVSHGDSASGNEAVATDALTLADASDMSRALKVSVMMYSLSNPANVNMSSMAALANSTLAKSNVCREINLTEREIDGQRGVFASGLSCTESKPVYAAVYPVEYHLDRPGGILQSNAIGLILSTYDSVITERFIKSVEIVQVK